MYAKSIRITMKNGAWYEPFGLARWIQKIAGYNKASDALFVARRLLKGEGWEPAPHVLKVDPRETNLKDFIDVKVEHFDDAQNEREQRLAEEGRLWALMPRGAAGDAESAIEFCKAIESGKISLNTSAFA